MGEGKDPRSFSGGRPWFSLSASLRSPYAYSAPMRIKASEKIFAWRFWHYGGYFFKKNRSDVFSCRYAKNFFQNIFSFAYFCTEGTTGLSSTTTRTEPAGVSSDHIAYSYNLHPYPAFRHYSLYEYSYNE